MYMRVTCTFAAGLVASALAAPAVMPVSQIGDGQIQASTYGAPVSQISDVQIQAPTYTSLVSQIGDVSFLMAAFA